MDFAAASRAWDCSWSRNANNARTLIGQLFNGSGILLIGAAGFLNKLGLQFLHMALRRLKFQRGIRGLRLQGCLGLLQRVPVGGGGGQGGGHGIQLGLRVVSRGRSRLQVAGELLDRALQIGGFGSLQREHVGQFGDLAA